MTASFYGVVKYKIKEQSTPVSLIEEMDYISGMEMKSQKCSWIFYSFEKEKLFFLLAIKGKVVLCLIS
jgi:hypothetical protein